MRTNREIVEWERRAGVASDPAWEAAYVRFETPRQELEKFRRRLAWFGAGRWNREAGVVELFCGRGSGLEAWADLGFRRLEGVDLSERLLRLYQGEARLYLGDCRFLGLPDASRDIVCVQGGLHHLENFPTDLRQTIGEAWRVLRTGGRFIVVEPWLTPFLRLAHWACRRRSLRRAWPRLEALASMIERERGTYEAWLARPGAILRLLEERFEPEKLAIRRGKLAWMGRKAGPA